AHRADGDEQRLRWRAASGSSHLVAEATVARPGRLASRKRVRVPETRRSAAAGYESIPVSGSPSVASSARALPAASVTNLIYWCPRGGTRTCPRGKCVSL